MWVFGSYLGLVRSKKRGSAVDVRAALTSAGQCAADFGEAGRDQLDQKAYFFAFDLPHSDACYIRAYPAANTEAWLDGHVHAFAFLGAVPQSILYDNDKCLVARIMPDGTRNSAPQFPAPPRTCPAQTSLRTQRFRMLSHYVIKDRYGRPGKGNDKGKVEGLVGYGRRNFMVPMPRFADWDAFNDHLEDQCRKRQGDILRGHKTSIGARLEADLAPCRIYRER